MNRHLHFLKTEPGVVGLCIRGNANKDSWRNIAIYYNAKRAGARVELNERWRVAVAGRKIDTAGKQQVQGPVEIPPIAMLLLFQE